MKIQSKRLSVIAILMCVGVLSPKAFSYDFPGKGEKQAWLQACDLCNQSNDLLVHGRVEEAFKGFDKAVDLYPYDVVLMFDAGFAHQQYAYKVGTPEAKRQQLTQAEALYRKATQLTPNAPDVWTHLANVQCELNEYAASLKSLETILPMSTLSPVEKQKALAAIEVVKAKITADSTSEGSSQVATTTAPAGSSDWQSYNNAAGGFSMQYPNGWKIASDPSSGRIDVSDASGAKLSILPFFSPTKIEPSALPAFFSTFIQMLAPNEKWSQPERVGDNGLRATYSSDTETAVAAIALTTTAQGTGGRAAVARIPKSANHFPADKFAVMMSSLRFNRQQTPEQVAQQQAYIQMATQQRSALQARVQQQASPLASGFPPTPFTGYREFSDPVQNSFSVEVPVGWNTTGGIVRNRAIDARPWVKVVSPDGLITAFMGDGEIPPYSIPTAMGMRLGYLPGGWYGGAKIRNYTPARQYVEEYARSHMKGMFTDMKVVEAYPHPDVAALVNGSVGATRSECWSIKLTCLYKNIPAVAYYVAATKETVMAGAGMWFVNLIAGEIGPADRDAGGLSVILHMLKTYHLNSEWKAESVKTAGEVSRQYTIASQQASQAISNRYWSQQASNESLNQAYWGRQAVQDHAADNFSNYIRGVENVKDPQTGTQYQVNYGPQYHWIDQSGNVAGTNYSAPGPEWRQLMSVP
jgi:Tetratricopeptide repeat